MEGEDDFQLVGEASDGQEAVDRYSQYRPDVTLIDIQMPVMNGIDAIREIRKKFPAARLVVLTTYKGDIQALKAFKAGATGYLLKNMIRKDLLDTIRMVHSGHRRVPEEIAVELIEHIVDDALTDRELEVLRLVAVGTSNKAIADNLGVSEATVKMHMKSILSKLYANDRTHAVTIAMKRGYIDL
jgi:DNA-binding NarL/FixJ family response regulator